MLSRVAEALFWTARNVERAETLARLLEVTSTRSVDRGRAAREAVAMQWDAVYNVAGLEPPDTEPRDAAAAALSAIGFGGEGRLSMAACIRIARQNAVGVRAELTSEVWESINALYLYVDAQSPEELGPDGGASFLRNVRDATQSFVGIVDATLTHDDAWEFLIAGRYLERASMTARILRAHQNERDPAAWQRFLETCNASEPFARAGRQSSDPDEAMAFVALDARFPRSLRFCAREVDGALHRLSGTPTGTFGNEAERTSGSIAAELDYADAGSVRSSGARAFGAHLTERFDSLGAAITTTYFPQVYVA
jgi:uncharacterized alpha-E superfamily protein